MMQDRRIAIRDGWAMHTPTNAVFEIDASGSVQLIYQGEARGVDLDWIAEAVLAEIEAARTRAITGQFMPG